MRSKVNLLPDDIKFQVVQEYLSGGFIQKDLSSPEIGLQKSKQKTGL